LTPISDRAICAQQRLGDVVLRQQVLVLHALGRRLVLDLLDARVDLSLVNAHAVLPRAVEDDLELDEALERLAGERVDVGGLRLLLGLLLLLRSGELRLDHVGQAADRDLLAIDGRRLAVVAATGAAGHEQRDGDAYDGKHSAHGNLGSNLGKLARQQDTRSPPRRFPPN
jgi:hypothetical protein